MKKLLKIAVVSLLVVLSAFVQLVVPACAFRVTGNLEWSSTQLLAFIFDGLAILAALRFLRRQPSFVAAACFVSVANVSLFFLAMLARNRFPDWFDY